MSEPTPTPKVSLSEIENQIKKYLECWSVNEKRFFNFSDELRFRNFFQENLTPCEQQYLLISKFPMPGLEYKAFRKLPQLLLDTERYQVNHDHYFYWAFAADVYDFFKSDMNSVYDNEIAGRFHLLMDVLMSSSHNPNRSVDQQKIQEATRALSPRMIMVQSNSFIIAAHMAYPLLEGICRRLASTFVNDDGSVRAKVENFASADGDHVQISGSRINRLNTLLRLVETKVVDEGLRKDLSDYRNHFEGVYSKYFGDKKSYDIIDEQRNSLLHGEAYWQIFFASMINLICTLLTSQISEELFNSKYPELIKRLDLNQRMAGFQTGYYPPALVFF